MKNINVKALDRERITINNDENRVIELNTSDFNIVSRFAEMQPKLQELSKQAPEKDLTAEADSDTFIDDLSTSIKTVDNQIRECINYIFDYDVCAPMVGNASLLSVVDGKAKYEYILEALTPLYNDSISAEMQAMNSRINSATKDIIK
jgi:hypothetical protein